MTASARPASRVILGSLSRLSQILRDQSREIQARVGLSAAGLFVLEQLQSLSPVSIEALADHCMAGSKDMARIVKGLEEKGLAQRRPAGKSGRLHEVWISAEGKLKLRQCPDSIQSRIMAAVESLGGSRRESLASGFASLLDVAGYLPGKEVFFTEKEEI